MTRKTHQWQQWTKLPLAVAVAAGMSGQAAAYSFYVGDVEASFNTTLSAGATWRTQDPDRRLIAQGNLGPEYAPGQPMANIGASTNNYDDGNLNFEKGDTVSKIVKGNSELFLNYNVDSNLLTRVGGFVRGRYWYDFELKDESRATDYVGQQRSLNSEAKDNASGGELLDAYVFTDWYLGNVPLSVRYGKQVLSWGESTFIQGGINSINPVDASAFRKPGAEVKEGLLPVSMAYTSIGITGDITLEAFYQLEWEKTRIDPCGTFFSTVDFVADGCGPVILGGEADERDMLAFRQAEIDRGVPLSSRVSPITERISDDQPKDSGQFGAALRWYSEALGDTEFGLYYMNLHSRMPFINGVVSNYDSTGTITGTPGAQVDANAAYDTYRPLYQIAYPEDIQIMGVSFARSTESGMSIGGEISYKPDAPLQWNAFELILAGSAAPYSRLYQQRAEESGSAADLYGELAKGYDEFDIWQAQTTIIKFFDRAFGADRIALVAEFGLNFIPDLPDTDDARYGRSGAYGIGNNDGVWDLAGSTNFCTAETFSGAVNSGQNVQSKNCTDDGYVTKLSGGIRLRGGMDYNNAFAGINMSPNMSVAYDKGNGPEPGSQFIDDRLTVGLGVSFVYLNQTSVDVSYTNFSGGKYNQLKDRDNVSLSAKYSF
jgi:hypothetical protein